MPCRYDGIGSMAVNTGASAQTGCSCIVALYITVNPQMPRIVRQGHVSAAKKSVKFCSLCESLVATFIQLVVSSVQSILGTRLSASCV